MRMIEQPIRRTEEREVEYWDTLENGHIGTAIWDIVTHNGLYIPLSVRPWRYDEFGRHRDYLPRCPLRWPSFVVMIDGTEHEIHISPAGEFLW